MVSGPLRQIRVLDLTHVWAGPLAGRFLADLGAQVVKVEAPMGRGPQVFPSAPIGGFMGGEPSDEPWNRNALFAKLHRNRRSVCIDLKQDAGREVFLQLAEVADVIIENFSAGAMDSLGLGYERLKQTNPNIVYVAMSGFGGTGPRQDRVAFGPVVEAMSGLTTVLGYEQSQLRNSAIALMDPVLATNAAAAVVTALRQRKKTGLGAYLDWSLYEAAVSSLGPWLAERQLGRDLPVYANAHPQMSPHGVYPCAGTNNWIALACENDTQWRALAREIPDLDSSLCFADRQRQSASIDQSIIAWSQQMDKVTACQRLQEQGIPAGAVNTTPDMVQDSHVQARGFFVKYEAFDTPMPGNPIKLGGLNSAQWTSCPKLGAHNQEVLEQWLGYECGQVDVLKNQGVLHDQPPA